MRRKNWEQLSQTLTASEVSLVVRGLLHLVEYRAYEVRVQLCRGFYEWKKVVSMKVTSRQFPSDLLGEIQRHKADVLAIFIENHRLETETLHLSLELWLRMRETRENGSWVVLRRFVKDRIYAKIRRAFSRWVLASKVDALAVQQHANSARELASVQEKELNSQQIFWDFYLLRVVLMVYIFHQKWKINSFLALMHDEQANGAYCRRTVWNELVALRRGTEITIPLELSAVGVSEKLGYFLSEKLLRVLTSLKDLRTHNKTRVRHRHRNHDRHHNRHHHVRNNQQLKLQPQVQSQQHNHQQRQHHHHHHHDQHQYRSASSILQPNRRSSKKPSTNSGTVDSLTPNGRSSIKNLSDLTSPSAHKRDTRPPFRTSMASRVPLDLSRIGVSSSRMVQVNKFTNDVLSSSQL